MESDETLRKEGEAKNRMLEAIGGLRQEISARAIAELSKRFDNLDKRLNGYDSQFEAIRQGLVANNVAFDRLQSTPTSRAKLSKN